jgi:hypothetical protein
MPFHTVFLQGSFMYTKYYFYHISPPVHMFQYPMYISTLRTLDKYLFISLGAYLQLQTWPSSSKNIQEERIFKDKH